MLCCTPRGPTTPGAGRCRCFAKATDIPSLLGADEPSTFDGPDFNDWTLSLRPQPPPPPPPPSRGSGIVVGIVE